MRFKQDQVQVLHLGWSNRRHKYAWGKKSLSSTAEKDLGVLVNMSRQYILAPWKSSCVLGCIRSRVVRRSRMVIQPLYTAMMIL